MVKHIGTLVTALLILLLAGSAMCATYDSNVTLVEKNSTTWQVVPGGASVLVEYNQSGEVFEWHATGNVTEAGCYHLIYYGDNKTDKNAFWGGHHPGAWIGDISTNYCGTVIDVSGEIELGMNLPSSPDGNMDYYDYSGAPDFYDPGCGAKLWIVHCDDYIKTEKRVINYQNRERWLFETDLIWYDDTGENETPVIEDVWAEGCGYDAGDIVTITALVCDQDGVDDLGNMVVTANFSEYGVEELVVLEMDECEEECSCICREYTGSVVITTTGDICVEVTATDQDGLNGSDDVCFIVEPGPCAQLVIEGPDKALTRKSFCQWFDDENYAVYLDVTYEDGYGNPTDDCDCELYASGTGSASVLWWQDHGWVIRVSNFDQPETVTITAHCVYDSAEPATHDITFLNQIENLSVTSDPGFLYEMDDCSKDRDCVNISAELTDISGEPILMPDVYVEFIINGCWYDGADTDENGTATIELCMSWEYDDSIDVLAVAICREGTMTLDIVEPELYRVEIINETTGGPVDGEMNCTEGQDLNYTCYTNHSTEMCCPECPPTWSCDDLGEVNDTGYFTALDSGTCVVMVNVSGVIGTGEIVIDCPENCTEVEAGVPFVVTSGSVYLSGNFTEDCDAVCVQAFGDPIPEFDNDTRGAEVETCELATLDLNGTGAIWMKNETTGNWSKYADGDTADVLNGTYALVVASEPDPEPDPEPDLTPTATTRRGGCGSSGGTYPPNWDKPKATGSSGNATLPPEPEPEAEDAGIPEPTTTADGLLGGGPVGDNGNDTEPTPTPESPGFAGVFVILGILIVAYLHRRTKR